MTSSTRELIRNTPKTDSNPTQNDTVTLDKSYIDQSVSLFKDALGKGMDVAQLANGDLMITETKTVTYRYRWDNERKKFERHNNSVRRPRKTKLSA